MIKLFKYISCVVCLVSCSTSDENTEKFSEANSLLKTGDYSESIRIYKELINDSIIDKRIYNNIGVAYLKSGKNDSASVWFQNAISLDENYYDAKLNYLQAMLAKAEFKDAVNLSSQMMVNYPDSTVLHLISGIALMQLNEFDQATNEFNAVIDKQPENADANLNLGTIMLYQGDREGAREKALFVISQNASRHEAFNLLGMVLLSYNQNEEAIDAFDNALSIKQNANYFNNKAQALLALNQLEKAVEMLEKSKELNSDNYYLWRNYAWHSAITNSDSVEYYLQKAKKANSSEYVDVQSDSIFDRLSSTQ
ncbi:tetratricopeptide repeat protein [Marinigracilibium pacificum]|uniref:Tetratricopeptide repeat protein n=1 Tax=Marinigracilibium pacificum TaxID=2729599 RepID=A0A848J3R2_9BACT|nr:tetratricopeptide repeat protein [Marinigracilibium pacificum]NMM49170.1 tetratricopeptide repeat protein [Marinigracilibium pacificum]